MLNWKLPFALLMVLLLVLFWSAVLAFSVRSEALWNILPTSFKLQPQYAAQRVLMNSDAVVDRPVLIGDSDLRKGLQLADTVTQIEVNAIDPFDIRNVMSEIRLLKKTRGLAGQPCVIAFQFSPHYLLRMNLRGGAQDFGYYRDLRTRASDIFSDKLNKRFFTTLSEYFQYLGQAEESRQTADRPKAFPVQLSLHDPDLENWERLFAELKRSKAKLFLIFDDTGSDYTTAPGLIRYAKDVFINDVKNGRFKLDNLTFVTLDEAKAQIPQTCSEVAN